MDSSDVVKGKKRLSLIKNLKKKETKMKLRLNAVSNIDIRSSLKSQNSESKDKSSCVNKPRPYKNSRLQIIERNIDIDDPLQGRSKLDNRKSVTTLLNNIKRDNEKVIQTKKPSTLKKINKSCSSYDIVISSNKDHEDSSEVTVKKKLTFGQKLNSMFLKKKRSSIKGNDRSFLVDSVDVSQPMIEVGKHNNISLVKVINEALEAIDKPKRDLSNIKWNTLTSLQLKKFIEEKRSKVIATTVKISEDSSSHVTLFNPEALDVSDCVSMDINESYSTAFSNIKTLDSLLIERDVITNMPNKSRRTMSNNEGTNDLSLIFTTDDNSELNSVNNSVDGFLDPIPLYSKDSHRGPKNCERSALKHERKSELSLSKLALSRLPQNMQKKIAKNAHFNVDSLVYKQRNKNYRRSKIEGKNLSKTKSFSAGNSFASVNQFSREVSQSEYRSPF